MTNPLATLLDSPSTYARYLLRTPLRPYQDRIAQAIAQAIRDGGTTLAIELPRQTGKNQITATVEAWILTRTMNRHSPSTIVKCAPSARPQLVTSMERVCSMLDNPLTLGRYKTRLGYIVTVNRSSAYYLSAAPAANVVGATATLALFADEAQEIDAETYDRKFTPMTASTNAAQVLTGTAWTTTSLLARTAAEVPPSHHFRLSWQEIAEDLPTYGAFVRAQIARLGADHPIIQTQYELNAVDPRSTPLLTAADLDAMHDTHARAQVPDPQPATYLLVDAGATFTDNDLQHRADQTAYTVCRLEQAPDSLNHYRILDRATVPADPLQLAHIATTWGASVIIDATGPGSALAAALLAHYPDTQAVTITSTLKTALGWGLLAIVKTHRYHDYADDQRADTRAFWQQAHAATRTITGNTLSWGVPDRTLHDDLLTSAALCAMLESAAAPTRDSYVIESEDAKL